jgi:ApaG protein
LQSHSDPSEPRYVFAYNVHIKNRGDDTATLVSRHWIITDASGKYEEVRGPGIVGETPELDPGQEHAYQSFCVLKTPRGTMHGSYQMVRKNGETFDAEIPSFVLSTGTSDAKLVLN